MIECRAAYTSWCVFMWQLLKWHPVNSIRRNGSFFNGGANFIKNFSILCDRERERARETQFFDGFFPLVSFHRVREGISNKVVLWYFCRCCHFPFRNAWLELIAFEIDRSLSSNFDSDMLLAFHIPLLHTMLSPPFLFFSLSSSLSYTDRDMFYVFTRAKSLYNIKFNYVQFCNV